jgi:uncharacterized membrane protein
MPPHDHDSDHIREHKVSVLLRAGVVASGASLLLGFVLYAAQPAWHDMPDVTVMWRRLLSGDGVSPLNPFIYLYFGLILLMFTPIARVAMTAWMFAREHDRRYTLISLAVLLVLSVSIALSYILS